MLPLFNTPTTVTTPPPTDAEWCEVNGLTLCPNIQFKTFETLCFRWGPSPWYFNHQMCSKLLGCDVGKKTAQGLKTISLVKLFQNKNRHQPNSQTKPRPDLAFLPTKWGKILAGSPWRVLPTLRINIFSTLTKESANHAEARRKRETWCCWSQQGQESLNRLCVAKMIKVPAHVDKIASFHDGYPAKEALWIVNNQLRLFLSWLVMDHEPFFVNCNKSSFVWE